MKMFRFNFQYVNNNSPTTRCFVHLQNSASQAFFFPHSCRFKLSPKSIDSPPAAASPPQTDHFHYLLAINQCKTSQCLRVKNALHGSQKMEYVD